MPNLLGPWRPKGWVNPHADALAKEIGWPNSIYESVFEDGATALLEALKAGGVKTTGAAVCRAFDPEPDGFPACVDCPLQKHPGPGDLIFIPEAQHG